MLDEVLRELVGLVVGPFGAVILATIGLTYITRAAYKWVMDLWKEHLRVDHERAAALVKANDRVDALRISNDANLRIIERAVSQNERLVAAVIRQGKASGEG